MSDTDTAPAACRRVDGRPCTFSPSLGETSFIPILPEGAVLEGAEYDTELGTAIPVPTGPGGISTDDITLRWGLDVLEPVWATLEVS